MLEKLESIYQRFLQVETQLSDPAVLADVKKFNQLNREYGDLKDIVEVYHEYKAVVTGIDEAKDILSNESDPELKEMAKMELDELSAKRPEMEERIKWLLIPKDPNDNKNVIVEIRSGTGGDEASLFAGDLYRMYERYCQNKGWKTEVVEVMEGTVGGYNKVVFEVKGNGVYGTLKFESGVHRVQRVPETESQGRVHTSAATVAVLPEADEVDVDLNMGDVRRDTFRASGAGGQHVNKTESAIRLTHIPTGIVVECQDGRSQHQNYDKALTVLRTRLYEKKLEEHNKKIAAERKSLVSTGDRSAKIRTYNFPQSRVTDHRINLTLYNLSEVLGGNIQEVIDQLQLAENTEKLKAGGLDT
jgi:peptide chain release factor 1